jgi:signal transduction histidine kinase
MYVGPAALAFPASAALVLLVLRGAAITQGVGGRSFLVLAVTGVAGVVAICVAARAARRRQPATLSTAAEALLRGVATPLGDAALAFDGAGRLAWCNDAAAALCGVPRDALAGRGRELLGADLAVLLRGLERGPAVGRVTLATPSGARAAQAAAVQVPGVSAFDVVVLRIEPLPPRVDDAVEVDDADIVLERAPERPAPLDGAAPSPAVEEAAAALAAQLRGPLGRASAAAALLRLAAPALTGAAEEHLARIERELGDLEATLADVTAPLAPPSLRRVDVDALLSDTLARTTFAPGVSVRRVGGSSTALADAAHLRQALRHLLRVAAAAMPAGGQLGLRCAQRGTEVVLEIADTGAGTAPGSDLARAERLVAVQGGRLERASTPGRGSVCRLALPAAPGFAAAFDSSGTGR